jgi:hypothetical protein
MEIEWVGMTGRWPVETAPLLTDLDGDGARELVAVNNGGQVLLWKPDGAPIGSGPDGMAATLPEGKWSSSPVRVDTAQGPLVLVCGGDKLVLALGPDLKERWRFTLPGETVYGRAVPAVLANNGDPRIGYLDQGGSFTVLKADGTVAWSKKSDEPKGGISPVTFRGADGAEAFLVPLGTKLVCLSANGDERWTAPVLGPNGKPVFAKSVPAVSPDEQIVCLGDKGVVASFGLDGSPRWTLGVNEELDYSLAVYPRADGKPLFVFTGLWGNLFAVDADGKLLWKHLFRSKNRGVPLVLDVTGDGQAEIVQGLYSQHVRAFDAEGRLVDDLRLNGLVTPTLTPLPGADGRTDFLVMTTALLAYRIGAGPAKSPYAPAAPGKVAASWRWTAPDENQNLRVENPTGALVSARVTLDNKDGSRTLLDSLTTQSLFAIELPKAAVDKAVRMRAEVCDSQGNVLVHAADRSVLSNYAFPAVTLPAAWATEPCGAFSEARTAPVYGDPFASLSVDNLYVGEADQTAFVVAAGAPLNVRIELEQPKNGETPFAGSIRFHRVVPVGTWDSYNERRKTSTDLVPDALAPLAPSNTFAVAGDSAAKIWVAVDARGAAPGKYAGKVTLTGLPSRKVGELPLTIDVLPLAMPERFPLELCTWDYVPNRWHPDDTAQVLDDMRRHGVNIFPRSAAPEASVDAGGALKMDYAKLDVELDRLEGRGTVLFQITHPAITFATPPEDAAKRAFEIKYLRAFVEHLNSRGIGYEDFAFYPVDEPGLDYGVQTVELLIDAAGLFQEADPAIRVYTDPVPSLSRENFERIAPLIDVWCPNMRQVTGLLAGDERIRKIMDSGAPVWSYECVGLVKSLSPLRYNRANPWRAWYFGLDGIGYWTHSQNTRDMWYPSDDEYALVYPGELPVPSVRWESVRDGMEDIAALALLEQAIAKGGPADALARAQDVLRIAKNDVMEMSDAAYVESRDYLAQGDRRIWHTPADIEAFRRIRAAVAEATLALQSAK